MGVLAVVQGDCPVFAVPGHKFDPHTAQWIKGFSTGAACNCSLAQELHMLSGWPKKDLAVTTSVAIAGHCCGSDSVPGLGISICPGCSHKI